MSMAPYTLKSYYRVKAQGRYPWPCAAAPNRTIELFLDDVLTKDTSGGECHGTYMKHTGLGCFRIVLQDDEVEAIDRPVHLVGI